MPKKKNQLKPVNRGFATKSIPKKLLPEPTEASAEDSPVLTPETLTNPNDIIEQASGKHDALEKFIEKYQERTIKEVNRILKVSNFLSSHDPVSMVVTDDQIRTATSESVSVSSS